MADFFYHKYNFSSSTRQDTFRSIRRHLCFFLGGTPWNRSTGIITFFAVNQEGVDQSFSSSNSTEISMRRFYAQNFITIGLAFGALSCKRTAGRTDTPSDSIVSSLFEYTKTCLSLSQSKTNINFFLTFFRKHFSETIIHDVGENY